MNSTPTYGFRNLKPDFGRAARRREAVGCRICVGQMQAASRVKKGYEKYQLAFIVLRVFSNRLKRLLPFVDDINVFLDAIHEGEVHH